ncbi:LysR family transcriptional regulator [Achromobacter denitrificans]|uniref:LysR substrate-binding domain-containing protein n=1 Tax=Achromobacter TaxID=222 RepID=UPI000F4F28B3|nr:MULTISPECIES: LysR substrate-binding domain-containing protein [Achromobacter]MBV2161937.1 LysR family transcriptional regulator [Achromobacter denitrificans]MDF3848851.1 LysR substrate-binding domain-containing protein [Achromobacter denitrificans]MDF3941377.1 LysR substrate-binding domain-containing protein [Achromobacter denitrificans]MDX3988760.1 LysR substrate-binding domain-containing protein [Achromobacter sp.]QCS65763.1 LysR family transcriptional regulator [Achromobacter denitrific
MKDHHLRAWLKVAELRSIRAAARSLHLSQAAVTKAIKELEAELEAPLLTRSAKGIALTECGEHLTVRARLAQAQLTLARQDIRQLLSGAQARVAVGVTPMVMLSVLPEVLRDFRRSMPAAKIKVSEGLLPAVQPALRNGTLDFAVASRMADSSGDSEFEFEVLRPLEFMIACRRGHPLAGATRWEDLLGCEWLLNASAGSHTEAFLRGLRANGLQAPDRVIDCDTFGVMWNLMTRSDALILCPAGMLDVQPYGDEASRVRPEVPMPVAGIGIMTLRGTPLSLAAATMADLFRRRMAQAADPPPRRPAL